MVRGIREKNISIQAFGRYDSNKTVIDQTILILEILSSERFSSEVSSSYTRGVSCLKTESFPSSRLFPVVFPVALAPQRSQDQPRSQFVC